MYYFSYSGNLSEVKILILILFIQFSLGMALLLIEDPLQGFGLLVLGCSPGGTGSNFWTLLLGGDVNLSITMTFLSTIAALGK